MKKQPPPQPDPSGGMGGNEFTRLFGQFCMFEPLNSIRSKQLPFWIKILTNANLAKSLADIKPEYLDLLRQARDNAEQRKPA